MRENIEERVDAIETKLGMDSKWYRTTYSYYGMWTEIKMKGSLKNVESAIMQLINPDFDGTLIEAKRAKSMSEIGHPGLWGSKEAINEYNKGLGLFIPEIVEVKEATDV